VEVNAGQPAQLRRRALPGGSSRDTQWVRNLRVAGDGELRLGRHNQVFQATELGDAEKLEVLRAYLKRWKAEVGVFFGGVVPMPRMPTSFASRPTTRCFASRSPKAREPPVRRQSLWPAEATHRSTSRTCRRRELHSPAEGED